MATAMPPELVNGHYVTFRQKEILAFIRDYYRREQRPPTFREIQEGCAIGNVSTVHYQLHRLADKGLVELPAKGVATRAVRLPVRAGEPCPYCGRAE